ncbi:MAG: alpha/beta fold hydrolase [Gammaproteobacteria bacterium]|jgi:pimeloyl-[acyl-carrier protein] methyl ester esterase
MQAFLLHGWGIKQSIWNEANLSLPSVDRVLSPCLYEIASKAEDSLFDSIAQNLNDTIEQDTIIIAWSIGGLIAIPLQKLTKKIKAIVFVASSPCFVNKENWLNVIDEKNISALQASLKENTDKTLEYFSGLIAHGDTKLKQTNKTIRKHIAAEENNTMLSSWLDQMLTTDLRESFSEINCPVLAVFAENDSLIKTDIEKDLKLLNQNIETRIIKDCGHAPFLNNQQEFSKLINEFIDAKLY